MINLNGKKCYDFSLIFIILFSLIISYNLNETNFTNDSLNDSHNFEKNENLKILEDQIRSSNGTNNLSNEYSKSLFEELSKTEILEILDQDNLTDYEDDYIEKLIKQADLIMQDNESNNKHESNEKSGFNDEWEKEISEFEPAETLTFFIEENTKEEIYELIDKPSYVKFAYVINDEQRAIDFHVIDPNHQIIHSESEKTHAYFSFNARTLGEYSFILDNRINDLPTKITFAIHQGNSSNTHLNHDQLDRIFETIKTIDRNAKSSRFNARILNKKYDSHYEVIKKHNRNIVLFCLIETGVLLIIFFIQLCYIKKLAEKINI